MNSVQTSIAGNTTETQRSQRLHREGQVSRSLIRLAIVYYPPGDVPALRVMVRPMDDPAFRVPDILAVETNAVAYLKSVDSRGNVDVVCNKECLS